MCVCSNIATTPRINFIGPNAPDGRLYHLRAVRKVSQAGPIAQAMVVAVEDDDVGLKRLQLLRGAVARVVDAHDTTLDAFGVGLDVPDDVGALLELGPDLVELTTDYV